MNVRAYKMSASSSSANAGDGDDSVPAAPRKKQLSPEELAEKKLWDEAKVKLSAFDKEPVTRDLQYLHVSESGFDFLGTAGDGTSTKSDGQQQVTTAPKTVRQDVRHFIGYDSVRQLINWTSVVILRSPDTTKAFVNSNWKGEYSF